MATIGGRVLIAPTSELTSDLDATDTTMYVKHNNFASGDRARLEAGGNVEWIAITANTPDTESPYSYPITRSLDESPAND
jgi:hypothetical protein